MRGTEEGATLLTVTLFCRFPRLREKAQQFPVGEALACQLLPLPKCSDLRLATALVALVSSDCSSTENV